ncbi:hypothetical protein HQ393_02650 [Chitinibacter bivalviorum]|uniref:Uncharacterized protein n=1 Tax=Chitinibacter bivalviorum TaxID=2739434 RepID=A0A7H9BG59_9NEIS|nr:hypothetical protein [Chitinibacter bivalviorum]QLG87236.1 hypothetical protein HQ393_02650 [Chitinibacter bivalviorum]
MTIIPKEVLLAAAMMAKLEGLLPEQTMAMVFRALDHEIRAPRGGCFNPARTLGIGKAIYAALFNFPFDLMIDTRTSNGWRWETQIPDYGYCASFEQMFVQAQLDVAQQRTVKHRPHQADIAQNSV